MSKNASGVLPIDPKHRSAIEAFGATLIALAPMGAVVQGLELAVTTPPPLQVVQALEQTMAHRGFIVFKSEHTHAEEQNLQASMDKQDLQNHLIMEFN